MNIALTLLALSVGAFGDIDPAACDALYTSFYYTSHKFNIMVRVYPKEKFLTMALNCDGKGFVTYEDTFSVKGDKLVLDSAACSADRYQIFLDDFGAKCSSLPKQPAKPDLSEFYPHLPMPFVEKYVSLTFYVSGMPLIVAVKFP